MEERPHPRTGAPADPPRVAVIVSRFNRSITAALLEGALAEYESRGGVRSAVSVFEAAGSFELPVLALAAAESGRFDGVAALGCLIRGQTRHDRYIAGAVAHGLAGGSLRTGGPGAFGVLTVEDPAQAKARAGGKKGNKGADAMGAVLDSVECIRAIRAGTTAWSARDDGKAAPDKAGRRPLAGAGKRR